MNPLVDIHEPPATPPPAPAGSAKKKKHTPAVPAPVPVNAVTFTGGRGILLNLNDATRRDALLTTFDHGDIELTLEVMLPRGSNSGIYMQGRYEVQLLDSWGVATPAFSDIGGIYRNWETDPSKVYMGKAPLVNAAKAPGTWQSLRISFRAPRFDAAGKKTEHARFNFVYLNGVLIHNHVEVPRPTGGPIENNEKPTGPLMIQGDHGPVAIRNVRYAIPQQVNVELGPVAYQTFYGNFDVISDFAALKPTGSGMQPELSCEILDREDGFGVIYKTELTVPREAEYQFTLAYTGGARLLVNGNMLVNFQRGDGWWRFDQGTCRLPAGTFPIEILTYKNAGWLPPRLGFYVAAEGSEPKALHAFNSYPPSADPVSPILVRPGATPTLLRAFVDFRGDRQQRLTHTIGVGDPTGVHYVYDLKAGNLAGAWRGPFVNATPMWHDRGDGSFVPEGAVQYFFNNVPLAEMPNGTEAFPSWQPATEVMNSNLQPKGYRILPGGRPVFIYQINGVPVEDQITPDADKRSLVREIKISSSATLKNPHFKLAEGTTIQRLSDNLFVVDQHYYILAGTNCRPQIRNQGGREELITPVQDLMQYTLIW